MICEKCKEEGKTSKVIIKGSLQKPMHYEAFYDEHGIYHEHNPNQYPQGYECTNKHVWVTTNPIGCPEPGCDFKP